MTTEPQGYEDILYEKDAGIATITINRPDRMNSFRAKTTHELVRALHAAWHDPQVGAVILTGAGDRAFCAGGDMKERRATGHERDAETGQDADTIGLYDAIRNIPKPVIAAVNGFAIGGGHVIHVLCDLSIASETARFGQVGPRVGSFDAGYGTVYLARVVGEKKAREMWYLCHQYSAQEALDMGLVNKVVPQAELMDEARQWAREIVEKSPTAIKFLKYSFNADTASAGGLSTMAMSALELYLDTDEAREGMLAFNEKRPVDFTPYR
ncbi:MAG: hypothetical protein QOH61_2326 [Chloroflexota bacterium]|nr:hypothetical protein [Chloroflexota bacterium]